MTIQADIVGYAAIVIGSMSMVPQVVHVIRTQSAEDLSYTTIVMILVASALWHLYGWFKTDVPLRVSSLITISVSIVLVFAKYRYDNKVTTATRS